MLTVAIPDGLESIASELRPFIHTRNGAREIRGQIAQHLGAHVNTANRLPRPLSLLDVNKNQTTSLNVRSLHRDYLRALQANVSAKDVHHSLSNHQNITQEVPRHVVEQTSKQIYLDLIKAQQKHERLHIFQHYINQLNKIQPSAESSGTSSTDTAVPAIPSIVLNPAEQNADLQGDIGNLVTHTERTVLRAKMLLRSEQELLREIQSKNFPPEKRDDRKRKTRALANTRNEMIHWIENELAQDGLSGEDGPRSTHNSSPADVENQLRATALSYENYVSLRQKVLSSISENHEISSDLVNTAEDVDDIPTSEYPESRRCFTPTLLAYLEEMALLANEQKSITQQKSHMAVALLKHSKYVGQTLDRQAEESHLLRSYPTEKTDSRVMKASKVQSFAEDLAAAERPDLVQRVRGWAAASKLAEQSTKDVVSTHLGEGGSALLNAQEDLLELLVLLGDGFDTHEESQGDGPDIWHDLDGTLGVI